MPTPEKPAYGARLDGTSKGEGYFGKLQRTDDPKSFSTELSASGDLKGPDNKPVLYPLLVPTLTREEIDHLLSGKKPTPDIYTKAETFAATRLKQGLSPFASSPKEIVPVPESAQQQFQQGFTQ